MTSRVRPILIALLTALSVRSAAAQHPNVRVSSAGVTNPEEPTIAIDPANPQRLAGGANITYRYYSANAGLGWTEGTLTSTLGVAGDPVVHFDANGTLYFAHLSFPAQGDWLDRIVVQRSTDGGVTWNDGAGVGHNGVRDQDKPGLSSDMTSSPYRGRLYLAWTEFDAYGSANPSDSTRILFSRSSDTGQNWSAPLRVNDSAGDCIDSDATVEGAIPAVGPAGQVYLAWSGPGGIWFDRSFDGGATFGNDLFVAPQPGGWDFPVPGLGRSNGLPTTLCDISSSPYRGTIYVVWSDQRAGAANTDIFLARSIDGGDTWSAPVRVNGDASATHQFFPAATIDPTTGILYVAYYDRSATTGEATDVYLSRSVDGGWSFQSIPLSDTPFVPDEGVFFGDYIGVAAWDRRVHAIWTRLDGSALSIWTAQLRDTAQLTDVPSPGRPQLMTIRGASPNPLRRSTRLSYLLPSAGPVTIRVLDVAGREVDRLLDAWQDAGQREVTWDARRHAAGMYFVTVTHDGTARTEKLILVR